MAKKNETGLDEERAPDERGVSRRDLLKSGAVAGLGAAALLDAGCTQSQSDAASAASPTLAAATMASAAVRTRFASVGYSSAVRPSAAPSTSSARRLRDEASMAGSLACY